MLDLIIVGSGCAGLSAAIYAQRAMLKSVVIEKYFMGTGMISLTERVENYPGFNGINGYDLGAKFREHAVQSGAEFIDGEVVELSREKDLWNIKLQSGEILTSKTIIYCAGTSYRKLGVKGDDKQGISYCAVCDGAFYKGKIVAVVGGGDTALSDALYLSKLAEKVYLIHRRDSFRGNKRLQSRVMNCNNVELLMNTTVNEVVGEKRVERLQLKQGSEIIDLDVDGVFCALGSVPNTALVKDICKLDNSGYIVAGEDCVTSAKGLFAAGDVRTTPLRQVVTAAADGANAVQSVEKYLSE